MGVQRRNQPGYIQGIDKIGRRTWNKIDTSKNKDKAARDAAREALLAFENETTDGYGPDEDGWLMNRVYDGAVFTNKQFVLSTVMDTQFTGCELDGSLFSGEAGSLCEMERVSFNGSSLRNVTFKDCDFFNVEFADCDLTGVRFVDCSFSGEVNFELSNVTREQIQSLSWRPWGPEYLKTADERKNRGMLKYTSVSVEEVKEFYSWDNEEFFARVWAGDVEVLDNETHERTDGTFDVEHHHLPPWVLEASQKR